MHQTEVLHNRERCSNNPREESVALLLERLLEEAREKLGIGRMNNEENTEEEEEENLEEKGTPTRSPDPRTRPQQPKRRWEWNFTVQGDVEDIAYKENLDPKTGERMDTGGHGLTRNKARKRPKTGTPVRSIRQKVEGPSNTSASVNGWGKEQELAEHKYVGLREEHLSALEAEAIPVMLNMSEALSSMTDGETNQQD